MASNPLTRVLNDPTAARKTGVGRHEMKEMSGGNNGEMKIGDDDIGDVYIFGRGETDANITYLAMFNTNNQLCYIYPNAAGNGIEVSLVKP